jgi:hypothetical protein
MAGDPVFRFDKFSSLGYRAGVVLKGRWKNQDEIYDFIDRESGGNSISIISPAQTHSSRIAIVEKDHTSRNLSADGAISNLEDVCLTVRSADCIPMLMVEPSTGFFGAVHVGWRGLIGGIGEELFNLSGRFKLNPEDMHFYLGPSIRGCCFEVGDELAAMFDDPFMTISDGRFFVDLQKVLMNKLISLGVIESNMEGSSDCTSCLSDKYYSYRRDGQAPIQMVSFIHKA